jgi:tRNA U34 5-carboxymethylaminomethyl modifying GTPase MnmE/TrmE
VNRFEVAVIGLEKAGKSALLNAWLGQRNSAV